jgi:hypothetical protein
VDGGSRLLVQLVLELSTRSSFTSQAHTMRNAEHELHESPSDNSSSAVNSTACCLYPQLGHHQHHLTQPCRLHHVLPTTVAAVLPHPAARVHSRLSDIMHTTEVHNRITLPIADSYPVGVLPANPGTGPCLPFLHPRPTHCSPHPQPGSHRPLVGPSAAHNRAVMGSGLTAVA